jgi:toxin FitB
LRGPPGRPCDADGKPRLDPSDRRGVPPERRHDLPEKLLMTGWLLDTNILSELRKNKPEPLVVEFVQAQPLDLLFVSVVTFSEIRFGIELAPDPAHRAELNDWLTHKIRPMFVGRVLPISEDIMFKWRLLVEDGRKARHTFTQPDLIIAATGLHHGLTVVTRDTKDYASTRARIFNPWVDSTMHTKRP